MNPEIIGEPTPEISLPIDPRPTGFYATYGETAGDGETASYATDGITLSGDYAVIKGSTIWLDTLAASGLGLTTEEIDSLKLTDEELLTLGLTDEELLALRLQNEVYSMKNRWWEVKSGQFWKMLEDNSKELSRFIDAMGQRACRKSICRWRKRKIFKWR